MNSEISNVLKSSPVTVLRADKPSDEKSLPKPNRETLIAQSANVLPIDTTTTSLLAQDNKDKEEPSTAEQIKKAVDEGNTLLQAVRRNLQFQVDESTKEVVIKVVDSESGEIVRQIPSEEMLAFIKRLQEQGSMIQVQA
jgi:flagellar protein FlaG